MQDNIAEARHWCSALRSKDRKFQNQCYLDCGISFGAYSQTYDGSVLQCVTQHAEYADRDESAAAVQRNGVIATTLVLTFFAGLIWLAVRAWRRSPEAPKDG